MNKEFVKKYEEWIIGCPHITKLGRLTAIEIWTDYDYLLARWVTDNKFEPLWQIANDWQLSTYKVTFPISTSTDNSKKLERQFKLEAKKVYESLKYPIEFICTCLAGELTCECWRVK